MEEYDKQYPVQPDENDPMYDMYYYDNINGEYNDVDQEDQQFGDTDDENLNGLYVEGLADRIWEDND
eukprot:CAMPEP_0116877280 /NCGR_PEP_ID=MMETSP0463-20121206/9071_1 /TAXON_ID=181622 /ORGANISM="Strombidinopsis sp, Strain SopsisLIS2011" /LENGTH=66 /DNA_ID=CAMNT_0004524425 /DNA_START=1763 /DNA_END=1963 /DNA_ORIENTATION=+